jgi:membrane protease YdiL (CAAX protease family)
MPLDAPTVPRPGPVALAIGLALAQLAFALTFRGPRQLFWRRMTLTGLVLGPFATAVSPSARRAGIGLREVAAGAASAMVLYATFLIGDRLARRIMPAGEREIDEIYGLRRLGPPRELAARLVAIIAPAEELFWRGAVQAGLMSLLGRWRGTAAAIAAYGGVHLVTGNLTLTAAATVAGAHWALLYALGMPLGALVVSHALWDVWIFLVQPTQVIEDAP